MFRDKSGNGLASSIVKSSGPDFLFIALDRSVNTAVSSAISASHSVITGLRLSTRLPSTPLKE